MTELDLSKDNSRKQCVMCDRFCNRHYHHPTVSFIICANCYVNIPEYIPRNQDDLYVETYLRKRKK